MKLITYYYIANFKPRGMKEHYVGDGIWEQWTPDQTKGEIRKELARRYRTAANRIELTFHCERILA